MSDLVTDNLPLIATAPDGIKRLRGLILELAVRGKLVPQDPADEPASELLKRIEAEKARLVKEGKIRKQRAVEPVGEDERPFDLPESWSWTRIANLTAYVQRGKSPSYADKSPVVVISQKCVRWPGLDLFPARFISEESFIKYDESRLLKAGDLLWNSTGTGTIGRACLVEQRHLDRILVADSHVTVVRSCLVLPQYLLRWIQTPIVQSGIESSASGSTNQIELATSSVLSQVVPLPPLPEQHRIVARVDELMALCDRLEAEQADAAEAHARLVDALLATLTASRDAAECAANWQRLREHFDTLFTTEASITALKQTVLQLAVIGRLVPQDPTDEPASELLKRIEAEKVRLVKEGKIRKPKAVEPVGEDKWPFELPDRWRWTRLEAIAQTATGGTPKTANSSLYGKGVAFIGPGNITNDGLILPSDKSLTIEGLEQSYLAQENDLLMVCIGGSIGKSALVSSPLSFNQQINLASPILINPKYLHYSFHASYFQTQVLSNSTGSATPIINRSKWGALLISTPPLPEQHRIVAKVDELMALCERLQADLVTAREHRARLADTLVHDTLH